jgi:hypothetical protein
VASRLLKPGGDIVPESCPHRFHDKKTKRLNLFITRYANRINAFHDSPDT